MWLLATVLDDAALQDNEEQYLNDLCVCKDSVNNHKEY